MNFPEATLLDDVEEAIAWYRTTGAVTPNATTGTGAIRLLENEFRTRLGVAACLAVGSCTSALFVAMQCCAVGPERGVLLPELDWPASLTQARLLGARSATYSNDDQGSATWISGILGRVTRATQVVVVSHAGPGANGMPALVRALGSDAVDVIEDAARVAVPSGRRDEPGSIGRFGCFSLGSGKDLDAGGGGILAIREIEDIERAVRFSQHPARQQLLGLQPTDDHGHNHRIHGVAAIVALWRLNAGAQRASRETHR